MGLFSFRKTERLCKRKQIQELFEKGSSFYLYPFKVFLQPHEDQTLPHQILISVPVRCFKRAVDRNLLKRRIREAYRIQKGKLPVTPRLAIGFIYTAKDKLPHAEVQQKIVLIMAKIDSMKRYLSGKMNE